MSLRWSGSAAFSFCGLYGRHPRGGSQHQCVRNEAIEQKSCTAGCGGRPNSARYSDDPFRRGQENHPNYNRTEPEFLQSSGKEVSERHLRCVVRPFDSPLDCCPLYTSLCDQRQKIAYVEMRCLRRRNVIEETAERYDRASIETICLRAIFLNYQPAQKSTG